MKPSVSLETALQRNFAAGSKSVVTTLLLAMVLTLSGCSDLKLSLYHMAMDFELSKSGLSAHTVDLNGKSVSYLSNEKVEGAPTLIMLHGFAANKENWLRFSCYLSADYHIIAPDLPGHGASVKDLNLSYHISDQVGYLDELVTALGVDKFHLVGNSMGGAISSVYAAQHPDKVITVTLFDPAGIYDYESEYARRLEKGENPLIVENYQDFEDLMAFAMEEQPFVPWPITSVIAEKSIANKLINQKIFRDLRSDADQLNFKEELKKISVPTFVLWGEKDRVIAWQNAELFTALITNSRKLILPEVGHVPMIEVPKKSAEVLKTFISTSMAART